MKEQIQSSNVSKGGWRQSIALAKKKSAEEWEKLPSHRRLSPEEALTMWNKKAERRRELGLH